ncbi:MAG TPA: ArgE/DapE family deacylase [Streptosporangiaceae bacterium]|nr:ArgE/DapE family deacylase [Streptosporangiaceae bacterium]
MPDSSSASSWEAVDAAIAGSAESAFAFLERLTAAPSTVGHEMAAQQVVAAELDRIGFEVTALDVPEEIASRAPGGVAQTGYAGRRNILGRINPGRSPSLLLNGHVDVVPADDRTWTSDPFTPIRRDGWLTGRGAGDMKGGFAMGLLAVAALRQAMPDAITGELAFLSVIEEECTGNGTLAACEQGVLGDAVVLLEPTDLGLMLGGVGILWAEVEISGVPAHAESADRAVNPVDRIPVILRALAALESEFHKTGEDPAFAHLPRPYVVNAGVVAAGDWASSVPARARMEVRVGFPRRLSPEEALARLRAEIQAASAADQWLATHPPRVRASGFRAEGYLIDDAHPLVNALADAHAHAHGGEVPRTFALGSTTDARYYLNQFAVPAVAYGPRSRNIHATDEAVELASIVAGARTMARFIAGFFASGGLR